MKEHMSLSEAIRHATGPTKNPVCVSRLHWKSEDFLRGHDRSRAMFYLMLLDGRAFGVAHQDADLIFDNYPVGPLVVVCLYGDQRQRVRVDTYEPCLDDMVAEDWYVLSEDAVAKFVAACEAERRNEAEHRLASADR